MNENQVQAAYQKDKYALLTRLSTKQLDQLSASINLKFFPNFKVSDDEKFVRNQIIEALIGEHEHGKTEHQLITQISELLSETPQ